MKTDRTDNQEYIQKVRLSVRNSICQAPIKFDIDEKPADSSIIKMDESLIAGVE